MSCKPPGIREWRPRFYRPKQMRVPAANGSRPLSLIDCTTSALKSDSATTVSERRPLVQDYFSGNQLALSSPRRRRYRQYYAWLDQQRIARQRFQFLLGIRSERFRIRAWPGNHAPDPPANLRFRRPARATVAANRADQRRENFRSHRSPETERIEFVL